jgi:hypothetical protein
VFERAYCTISRVRGSHPDFRIPPTLPNPQKQQTLVLLVDLHVSNYKGKGYVFGQFPSFAFYRYCMFLSPLYSSIGTTEQEVAVFDHFVPSNGYS